MHFQHLEGRSEASFWAMKESVSSMSESTSSANFFGKKKKKKNFKHQSRDASDSFLIRAQEAPPETHELMKAQI